MRSIIELRNVAPRAVLVVHEACTATSIDRVLDSMLDEVLTWAGQHRVELLGPSMARFAAVDGSVCEVDAGFLIRHAAQLRASSSGRVSEIALGSCEAAHVTHIGTHASLEDTYCAMEAWVSAHGYASTGRTWEEYADPPGTTPDQMRTDVFWPVRRA